MMITRTSVERKREVSEPSLGISSDIFTMGCEER